MHNSLIIIVFLLAINSLWAQHDEKYSRVKIDMHGRTPFALARLGLDVEHGDWQPNQSFTSEFAESELAILQRAGFAYTVLIDDVAAYTAAQNRASAAAILRGECNATFYPYKVPKNYRYGSMAGYPTYEELLATLDSMRRLYPNLITAKTPISDTLKTFEGRPLYWLRISDNADRDETAEPEVFYNALHHAREPNSLSQLLFYMWYLLENYATDPEVKFLLDNTALYFVPCVNPDGYAYNQSYRPNGFGYWRKNRRRNADGSIGVDLNRNYGFQWGINNVGSSNEPSSDVYRGTAPFSEAETRLIRQFCNARRFQFAFNYHSHGNLLIYPWGYSDQQTPDGGTFRGFSEILTRESVFKAGVGIETVGYNVNGNSDDWLYGEQTSKGKIFSWTPEVGNSVLHNFWPPRDAIMDLNKSCLQQNLTLAHLVHNYAFVTDLTPQYLTQKSDLFRISLKRYGLKSENFTVSIRSGSPNMSIGSSAVTLNLNQFQSKTEWWTYNLSDNIREGDEVVFLLSVNNGTWTRVDTIRKIYGIPNQPLNQNGNSMTAFRADSSWGLTTNRFFSAPSSITDSPNGQYLNNANTTLTTTEPIVLPNNASKILLRFRTYWETEITQDYVAPSIEVNGVFQPICGNLTRNHPVLNIPVYDGSQYRWLEEAFD
jgi:carboxypeptidase T